MPKNAIVYARYSTDLQNEETIDAQISACRDYAERQGWIVEQVFSDKAVTGTSFKSRPGIQNLLRRVKLGGVDIVLCTATDRLSRDSEHSHHIYKTLTHHRIELHTSQSGKVNSLEFGLRATIAQDFIAQTAAKTHDGMKHVVKQGRIAAGLSYGYKVMSLYDAKGDRIPGHREIVPEQAEIVLRIFNDYANGKSPQRIAAELNEEGVPGPRGALWRDTAIRGHGSRGTGILNNELYLGRIVWNRQSFSKDPETEKRQARPNGNDQWITSEVPELKIVPVSLWNQVKAKQSEVKDNHQRTLTNPLNRSHRPSYLLSGLLECAECGGPYAIMAKDRYGCTNHKKKLGCSNSRTVVRSHIEERVIKAFPESLFNPSSLEDMRRELNAKVESDRTTRMKARTTLEKKLAKIDEQVNNLAMAIANGADGPLETLTGLIAKLEAERDTLEVDLHSLPQDTSPGALSPLVLSPSMFKTSLQALCSSEVVNASDEVKQAFIQLARSLIQKVIVAPRDKKGVDLTIHGHLATVLATLEAWREEESRLKANYHQEFVKKREAGAFQTVDDRLRFMERVREELESKKRSFERFQVSVVAGACNQRYLRLVERQIPKLAA